MSQDERGGASYFFDIVGTNSISMDAFGAFKEDKAYYALNGDSTYCTEIDICCTSRRGIRNHFGKRVFAVYYSSEIIGTNITM